MTHGTNYLVTWITVAGSKVREHVSARNPEEAADMAVAQRYGENYPRDARAVEVNVYEKVRSRHDVHL